MTVLKWGVIPRSFFAAVDVAKTKGSSVGRQWVDSAPRHASSRTTDLLSSRRPTMPLLRSVLILLIALAIGIAYRPVSAAAQPLTVVHRAPRKPAPGKPPLLVLLHGFGANEQDLLPMAAQLDPRRRSGPRTTRTLRGICSRTVAIPIWRHLCLPWTPQHSGCM